MLEVRQRLIGRVKRIAVRGHPQVMLGREREKLTRVLPGVGRDAPELAFLEQVLLIVKRRDIGQVDPGDGQRAAPVERLERGRHDVAHRSEQYRRVKRLGLRVIGALDRGGAQLASELPRFLAPGHHVDPGAAGHRHLRREVRAPAETVDAEHPAVRQLGALERPVADNAGAQQRREFVVVVTGGQVMGERGGHGHELGVAAVMVPAVIRRCRAEVLAAAAAVLAGLVGGPQPRGARPLTDRETGRAGTERDDLADHLMPGGDARLVHGQVALGDVQVGTADAADADPQQKLARRGLELWRFAHAERFGVDWCWCIHVPSPHVSTLYRGDSEPVPGRDAGPGPAARVRRPGHGARVRRPGHGPGRSRTIGAVSHHQLPVSTPASEGVAARGIGDFLDAIESAPDIEPHSLMIVRHGRVAAAGWWAPYGPERKHLLYSLSKSFTSAAAGFAVAEGLVKLDEPVISYFPEFAADITDPRSRAMLVRHVASMASGHTAETLSRARAIDPKELVRGFLLIPPDRDPGTVFAYNQPATYTLAAIVQKTSGQRLTNYLRPRLFDPLGIGEVAWTQDPPGRDIGFSGLHATTDAIAKLGLLQLNGGSWDGEQLLPVSWVAEATRPHISTANGAPNPASDWQLGYGFQFWMSRHGYRGDGAFGQYCLVLPDQDAVIAMTAATHNMQAMLEAAWKHLLPALDAGGDAGDDALAGRLSRLAVPPPPGSDEAVLDAAFFPDATFTSAGGAEQPSLTAVSVTRTGDGHVIRLTDDGRPIEVRCAGQGWTVSEPGAPVPIAAACGAPAPGTLTVDLIFLETPHRLSVTCSLSDRTFAAKWATKAPGDAPLSRHRAPSP